MFNYLIKYIYSALNNNASFTLVDIIYLFFVYAYILIGEGDQQ